MNDTEILSQIGTLTDKRQILRESHTGRPLSHAKTEQLKELESELEGFWAQLRQRRAWRQAGLGPDGPSDPIGSDATAVRRSTRLVR